MCTALKVAHGTLNKRTTANVRCYALAIKAAAFLAYTIALWTATHITIEATAYAWRDANAVFAVFATDGQARARILVVAVTVLANTGGVIHTEAIFAAHITVTLTRSAILTLLIATEAFALIRRHAVPKTTIRYANGLTAHGAGWQRTRISLSTIALIRFDADLIAGATGLTTRHAVLSCRIQLVARIANTRAIQVTLTMRTAKRTSRYADIAMIVNEFIKTFANAAIQAKSIGLTFVAAIRHAAVPVEVIALITLAALLYDIEINTVCTVAHYLHVLLELEEYRGHFTRTLRRVTVGQRQ